MKRPIAAGFLLVVILARVVPWLPSMPGAGPEPGWRQALNEAVARGLTFGSDILYTFGPYAAVLTGQYHPATDWMAVLGSALLGVSLALGLQALSSGRRAYALLLIPVLMTWSLIPDPYMLLAPLVFLALVCRLCGRGAAPVGWLAGIALAGLTLSLALLALVKGTLIGEALAMVALASTLLLFRRPLLAWAPAAGFCAGVAVFWMLAGQPLAALPGFFASEATVMAGYSEAMALPGPLLEIFVYLAGAAVLLALFYLGRVRRGGPAGWVFGAGLAVTLFLGFKAGFVRHDVHAVIAGTLLALAACLVAIELPPLPAGMSVALGLGVFLFIGSHHSEGVMWSGAQIAARASEVVEGVRIRLSGPQALPARYANVLASLRTQWPVAPASGPVDVYSGDQWGVLANRMDWSPRPNIQSITAYSETLARADLAHLTGPRAPQTVFFRVEPIDNRLPALEDGVSWPFLLSHYVVQGLDRRLDLARLQRLSDAPALRADAPITQKDFALGQNIALPDDPRTLFATIDLQPTLLGRAFGMLYKPPLLSIVFWFPDGRATGYRYVAEMGQAGFVISPVVRNTADFVALGRPGGERPTSFTIVGGSGTRWLWQNHGAVSIFPLIVGKTFSATAPEWRRSSRPPPRPC